MVESIQFILLLMILSDVIVLYNILRHEAPRSHDFSVISKKLIIVLPVLQEEETIANTLDFLKMRLSDFSFTVVVVGNAKERNEYGRNPTLDIAREWSDINIKIQVIEYPDPKGIKAHQVNYALSFVDDDPVTTWCYIMDIDTRFSVNAFNELVHAVAQNHAIIQMHGHFLRGWLQNSILAQAFAAYQTRWTFVHEMARIRIFNASQIGMYHLVGHGLCMNLQVYRDVGGLAEDVDIEDVHLGYVCCLQGRRVHSCHYLEGADTPTTLKDLWAQQYGWSRGVLDVPLYRRTWHLKGVELSVFQHIQHVFAWWNYIRWIMNTPVVVFMYVSFLFGIGNFFISAVIIMLYGGTFAMVYRWLKDHQYVKECGWRFVWTGMLCPIYRSIPTWHGLVDALRGARLKKYKTRHSYVGDD